MQSVTRHDACVQMVVQRAARWTAAYADKIIHCTSRPLISGIGVSGNLGPPREREGDGWKVSHRAKQ